jgi:hypothetical protein
MSRGEEFKGARLDKPPKGYRRQLREARKECAVCWQIGGHDARCPKVSQAAAMRAAKEAK